MAHCYDKEGNPHFDLTPAKAKKAGLYFSVTEHQKVIGKPGLEIWKLHEHLKTAHMHPPFNGEDAAAYIKRIKGITYRTGGGAAELGSKIHAAIEEVLIEEKTLDDIEPELLKFVAPAIRYFKSKNFEVLDIEKTVVNSDEGYAGTADAACLTSCGKKFILDWKSRKTGGRKVEPYSGQPEQVAAYGAAYFGSDAVTANEVWGLNVFIATDKFTDDGEAEIYVTSYKPEEMARNYDTFCLVAELWRRIEGYDPRFVDKTSYINESEKK